MRPYPGRSTGRMLLDERIFSYRLRRARRTIENAFGILCSQWKIFPLPIHANEEHIKLIILAAVVLHNYLRKKEENCPQDARNYCPTTFYDRIDENGVETAGEWRRDYHMDAMVPLHPVYEQNLSALNIRRCLRATFQMKVVYLGRWKD